MTNSRGDVVHLRGLDFAKIMGTVLAGVLLSAVVNFFVLRDKVNVMENELKHSNLAIAGLKSTIGEHRVERQGEIERLRLDVQAMRQEMRNR